jgi:hypothetical protein
MPLPKKGQTTRKVSKRKKTADLDVQEIAVMEKNPVSEVKAAKAKERALKAEVLADLDKIVAVEDKSSSDEAEIFGDDYIINADEASDRSKIKKVAKKRSTKASAKIEQDDLSIESILSGRATAQKIEKEASLKYERLIHNQPAVRRRFKLSILIPLVVFILALLLVAEGAGFFGGAGRKSAVKFLSSIGAVLGISEGVPADEDKQADLPQVVVPSIISLNVLISIDGQEEGLAIPVIASHLIETDVASSAEFRATGSAPSGDARAVGTISIINETSNDYRFVATTRFLSPEGVLFRMKEAANIPANGTVDVEVYADKVGVGGDIEPTKFTIPGLSADLQPRVYGQSHVAMTGGGGTVTAVAESDIEAARIELVKRSLVEARENFKVMISEAELALDDLITSKELKANFPKVGTPSRTFDGEVLTQFSTLVIPETVILELLDKKMFESLPEEINQADYILGTPLYTVEAYDTTNWRAEVRVEAALQKL